MIISEVRVANFRKFEYTGLKTEANLNLIFGENGSGKTSILEAIHILHVGKSFRQSLPLDLIRYGETALSILGCLKSASEQGQIESQVKVVKTREKTDIWLDKIPVSSASKLARLCPVLVLDGHSFGVIEGSPKIRRTLFDRVLFHVKQGFFEATRDFEKALLHRNKLLKGHGSDSELTFWEEKLALSASVINAARAQCIEDINKLLKANSNKCLGPMELLYRKDYGDAAGLQAVLREARVRERVIGTTLYGPHKSEVLIQASGRKVAKRFSRGEVKLIVIEIVAAISTYISEVRKISPVILVDDLSAELDKSARDLAFERLKDTHAQLFVTALEKSHFPKSLLFNGARLFHVKQSQIFDH
jgi:DNA replication and repair protein RecF